MSSSPIAAGRSHLEPPAGSRTPPPLQASLFPPPQPTTETPNTSTATVGGANNSFAVLAMPSQSDWSMMTLLEDRHRTIHDSPVDAALQLPSSTSSMPDSVVGDHQRGSAGVPGYPHWTNLSFSSDEGSSFPRGYGGGELPLIPGQNSILDPSLRPPAGSAATLSLELAGTEEGFKASNLGKTSFAAAAAGLPDGRLVVDDQQFPQTMQFLTPPREPPQQQQPGASRASPTFHAPPPPSASSILQEEETSDGVVRNNSPVMLDGEYTSLEVFA